MTFPAIRAFDTGEGVRARLVEMEPGELGPGAVSIRAEYSGVNYKDALAVTGRGKILRRLPLNAGIDVAGVVEVSDDARFRAGDAVLVNGMGLGESQDGGFAGLVRVPADWIVPLPAGLTTWEAMALGTAGFSAALALHRMEQMGQRPEQGPVAVTGASGGVGSVAVSILAARGYRVAAISGRRDHHGYVASLGAESVVTPEELALGSRPLESTRFAGVVDNVGGELAAALVRHVGLWGNVALVGNAASFELPVTVFPMILRGVSLLGVSSANCPMDLRAEVWRRLGAELKPARLDLIASRTIALAGVLDEAAALVERRGRGRAVVDCRAL